MIDIALWRFRIGTFLPRQSTTRSDTGGVLILGLRGWITASLLLSLLLLCGDIESNPGPATKTNTRNNKRQSVLSFDGSVQDLPNSPSSQPSLADVFSAVNGLSSQFEVLSTKVENIEQHMSVLTTLQEQVIALAAENATIKEENETIKQRMKDLEVKLDDLESRSRRNNALFSGLPPVSSHETWQDCEDLVRQTITDKMGIDATEVKIDRAHRIPSRNGPGPIIVRFTNFKDRQRVLGAKARLKSTEIFINEDFTMRIRDIRRKLAPFLSQLRNNGQRASMVYDHLIVDGQRFNLDPTSDAIVSTRDPQFQITLSSSQSGPMRRRHGVTPTVGTNQSSR